MIHKARTYDYIHHFFVKIKNYVSFFPETPYHGYAI